MPYKLVTIIFLAKNIATNQQSFLKATCYKKASQVKITVKNTSTKMERSQVKEMEETERKKKSKELVRKIEEEQK